MLFRSALEAALQTIGVPATAMSSRAMPAICELCKREKTRQGKAPFGAIHGKRGAGGCEEEQEIQSLGFLLRQSGRQREEEDEEPAASDAASDEKRNEERNDYYHGWSSFSFLFLFRVVVTESFFVVSPTVDLSSDPY